MPSAHPHYGAPRLPRGQVETGAVPQLRLDAAFERLREVYAGRQKVAVPGTSPQYVSSVLHRETPCSLARFVELVCGLPLPERAFVLGALVEDAPVPDGPPLLEVAEATEATGEALACAQRILAAPSVTPRELEDLKRKVHRAERELEDVECAVAGRRT
jgi:hypothetical protein